MKPTHDTPFDVFISHSSKDVHVASAIKQDLQSLGIRCWKAPDDIRPGESWPSAISRALGACHAMVLVWSSHSIESAEVSKELTLGMRNQLLVIPYKIENIAPSGDWEYHLANSHWLDACGEEIKTANQKLAERLLPIFKRTPSASEPENSFRAPASETLTEQITEMIWWAYRHGEPKLLDRKGIQVAIQDAGLPADTLDVIKGSLKRNESDFLQAIGEAIEDGVIELTEGIALEEIRKDCCISKKEAETLLREKIGAISVQGADELKYEWIRKAGLSECGSREERLSESAQQTHENKKFLKKGQGRTEVIDEISNLANRAKFYGMMAGDDTDDESADEYKNENVRRCKQMWEQVYSMLVAFTRHVTDSFLNFAEFVEPEREGDVIDYFYEMFDQIEPKISEFIHVDGVPETVNLWYRILKQRPWYPGLEATTWTLGHFHCSGFGCKKDISKAEECFESVASEYDKYAVELSKYYLAGCCTDLALGLTSSVYYKINVEFPVNLAASLNWAFKAMKDGYKAYPLCQEYFTHVKTELAESFLKAIKDSNSPESRFMHASVYVAGGAGIATDFNRGFRMMREEAENGNVYAQYTIGSFWMRSKSPNYTEAEKWLTKAFDSGYACWAGPDLDELKRKKR